VIAKSLAQLWQDFDYAVIDSPPLLGVLMVNALAASQQLVIPVQTEHLGRQRSGAHGQHLGDDQPFAQTGAAVQHRADPV
jgi:hypothetical protein